MPLVFCIQPPKSALTPHVAVLTTLLDIFWYYHVFLAMLNPRFKLHANAVFNFGVMIEAVVRRCSSKKMFLKIRKFHRKTPVLESLFNQDAGFQVFSCKICEIFRTMFFTEHLQWLLLL